MEFFKKHVDTLAIIGAIISAMIWMNGKFNQIDKEITVIKTVLMMKDILPKELAKVEK